MRLLLLTTLLATGCSEAALKAEDAGGTDGDMQDDTGSGGGDDSDTGVDTTPGLEAGWYTVRASFDVREGAATVGDASIEVLVIATDRASIVCTLPLNLVTLAVVESPDPEVAPLWWEVDVAPTESACATLPGRLGLGVGALAADVRAQLGRDGLEAVAESLYGAYITADGGSLAAYGWAATKEGLAGDTAATLPPPDGTYQLEPVYLLPLP